jgi:predicted nucleotidyltransferase
MKVGTRYLTQNRKTHVAKESAPAYYVPVTDDLLQDITRKIAEAFQPDKIILFGSYAYGQPRYDSDLDLLVVTRRHQKYSVFERASMVLKVCRPHLVGIDVLVRTPKELVERLKIGDPFFQKIITQGQVLYERKSTRRRVGQKSRSRLSHGNQVRALAKTTRT